MATAMTGGPRRGTALSPQDVKALFDLMSQVVYGGPEREDLAFSGKTLASLFEAYCAHLLKLMDQWPELSQALQSQDAVARARALHERLRGTASHLPHIDIRGRSARNVPEAEAHNVRSLILGKGMEI